MLPTYQHGTKATVSVPYPIADGAVISPTVVRYTVTDEVGGQIVASTTIALPSSPTATIIIPGASNLVPDAVIRAMRVVTVTFVTASGDYTAVARYAVQKASLLIPMTNSFQTLDQALLTRLDLPPLDGWDVAEEAQQIPAMVTAHDRMCRLTYRYRLSQDAVAYEATDPYWSVINIRERTTQDLASWPEDFRTALRRAQLYEADQILKGDPVGEKRRLGIVSESIGEAKMFFNARPPLRLALCEQAIDILSPHLLTSRRIGRA
jgi:hypothetical protein